MIVQYVIFLISASQNVEIVFQRTVKSPCAVTTTLPVIGGKWKPVILHCLRNTALHFGELM